MKRVTIILSLLVSAITFSRAQQAPATAPISLFAITIPGFPDGSRVPVKYSQAAPGVAPGEGLSPAIYWTNSPAGTRSFVLHMHDLDVSKNKTTDDQLHWLVWNIPGTAASIAEGQPKGAQLPDGSYQISATGLFYRGPGAAADGPLHHYIFELYALDIPAVDTKPLSDELLTRKNVMQIIQGHVLGKAAYGGLFKRPK